MGGFIIDPSFMESVLNLTPSEKEAVRGVNRRYAPEIERLGVLHLARIDARLNGDDYLADLLADQYERGLNELPAPLRYGGYFG